MKKKAIFANSGRHLAALCLLGVAAMSSPAMLQACLPTRLEPCKFSTTGATQ